MVPRVAREQVLAFRLAGHHLVTKLPAGELLQAAAACGIRNAPPGAAPLALLARVAGLTPGDIDRAVEAEKTLIQVWSLRVTPFFVPATDLAVFTTALLPVDEASARRMLEKEAPLLDRAGLPAAVALQRIAAAAAEVLDGRVLTKGELQDGIEERVALAIWPWCDKCRLNHISDAQLHRAAHAGACAFGPRVGNRPRFVRPDQWLGRPLPELAPDAARAELVRRYLRCYGPSDAGAFGEWAGVPPVTAQHAWRLVDPELAAVAVEAGRPAWVLAADLPRLEGSPADAGVRLLPPSDPYLLLRDRATLVPDRALQRHVWRPAGTPAVVVAGGAVVGTWQMKPQGKRLTVTVEPFTGLGADVRAQVEAEAADLGRFRGARDAEVVIGPPRAAA